MKPGESKLWSSTAMMTISLLASPSLVKFLNRQSRDLFSWESSRPCDHAPSTNNPLARPSARACANLDFIQRRGRFICSRGHFLPQHASSEFAQLFAQFQCLLKIALQVSIGQVRLHILQFIDERFESRLYILNVGQANVTPKAVRTICQTS